MEAHRFHARDKAEADRARFVEEEQGYAEPDAFSAAPSSPATRPRSLAEPSKRALSFAVRKSQPPTTKPLRIEEIALPSAIHASSSKYELFVKATPPPAAPLRDHSTEVAPEDDGFEMEKDERVLHSATRDRFEELRPEIKQPEKKRKRISYPIKDVLPHSKKHRGDLIEQGNAESPDMEMKDLVPRRRKPMHSSPDPQKYLRSSHPRLRVDPTLLTYSPTLLTSSPSLLASPLPSNSRDYDLNLDYSDDEEIIFHLAQIEKIVSARKFRNKSGVDLPKKEMPASRHRTFVDEPNEDTRMTRADQRILSSTGDREKRRKLESELAPVPSKSMHGAYILIQKTHSSSD